MANIHSLSDLKKKGGDGRGGAPSGGGGGGFPGFPSIPGMGGGPQPNEKNIKFLHQDADLQKELRNAGGKLVVVDFTASWCGPCKHIAPIFAELSNKYTDVVFLKVDVDELSETAQRCGIKAMPTFQFYKNSTKVDEFSGADPNKLKATIEKHRVPSAPSDSPSSGGYVLGGSKTATPSYSQPTQSIANQTIPTSQDAPVRQSGDVEDIFLTSLIDMGFPKEQAEKALSATGGKSLEAAIDWCFNHPDDEEGFKLGGTTKPQEEKPMDTDQPKTETTQIETTTPMETDKSSELVVHNAICNGCMETIVGIRWKCAMCSDYDMCTACYDKRTHNPEHIFDAHEKDIENPEKKPLTPEELEEQKRRLQEKIRKKRQDRALEEKQAEIEREKNRIKSGKEAQEAKKLWEQKTREREEALKRKEKEDSKKAQMLIKQKIEQDRLEREAAKKKAQEGTKAVEAQVPKPQTETQPKKEYNEALIQIRFKDGNTIKATFKPTDPVRTVFAHVSLLLGTENFSLMTTFPRKIFSPKDSSMDTTTLTQAELVPTGTFIVQ